MKQFLALAVMAFLAACSGGNPTPASDSTKSADSPSVKMRDIQSPYPVLYSSKFEMDDPKNAESLLAIWKAYDNGNLATVKDMFADTVEVHLASGMTMRGSRDSILAGVQAHRNTFAAAVDEVHAIMAVKSTDKNEHWALIWGMEKDTYKNGKMDSTDLQETWMFDKDGKAALLYQFAASYMAPKGKK
ncbi:MAG TPA: nuclear transport factor 2 family protein [Puia sp.]|nr:nuclear transport factor 2 family protein [Puia sp.]